MLVRAFLGFCWSDESFYISTADRFYRGAVPFVDEWFRTQMSSLIMVPFYAVYVLITGGNAGIVLYFRLLYLLFCTAVAFVFFRVLRKEYPDPVAVICSLFIMCYAHLNNATLSYYMMSELFLGLALILIYDYANTSSKAELIVAGVSLALSVQSMPLFVIGYVIVMFAVITVLLISKFAGGNSGLKKITDDLKLFDITVYTTIGVAVVAAVFAVFMISRADLRTLFETLPEALVDNEHSNTWGYYIRKPHRCLTDVFGVYVTYAAYILIAVSFVFQKYLKRYPFCEIVTALDTVLFAVMTYLSFGHTGYIQVVFFICMIPVFFVSEKKNNRLFWLFVIPSGLVSVIYSFASSDFLYVIAIGCALGTSAGVCAIHDHASSDVRGGRALMALAVITLLVTFMLRLTNVYRDAPVHRLTQRITRGVAAGLYTTDEHLAQYNDVYDVIEEYCNDPAGRIIFSKILPWGYLEAAQSCGFPTTWRTTAYDDGQLEKFYDINPDLRPDIIVVLDDEYGSYDASGDVEDDHEPNKGELGEYWKEYIDANDMTKLSVTCGHIYRRKEKE
ncbi:MAG: hypothetical protein K6E49_03655 [Lachnospiraceae bacterium]|nr:hypothetical protein [Lachnospiraceae bacterium]